MVFGSIVANPRSQEKLDGLGANSGSLWSDVFGTVWSGSLCKMLGQFVEKLEISNRVLLTSFLRMLSFHHPDTYTFFVVCSAEELPCFIFTPLVSLLSY